MKKTNALPEAARCIAVHTNKLLTPGWKLALVLLILLTYAVVIGHNVWYVKPQQEVLENHEGNTGLCYLL